MSGARMNGARMRGVLPGPVLAWCPFPSEAEARTVAGVLLDEDLVACANIIPGMVSLYKWQGERGEGREVGVLFKTHAAVASRMTARLARLHSYQSPAIMLWDASATPQATSDWLAGLAQGQASGFDGHEPG